MLAVKKAVNAWVSLKLPKKIRIRSKLHFQYIFENGLRCFCSHGLVIVAPQWKDQSGFGVIASKKCGNAIRRNRLKRLFREFYRLHSQTLPANQDFIFIANPKIKDDFDLNTLVKSLQKGLSSPLRS